jgi:hypothetical protein
MAKLPLVMNRKLKLVDREPNCFVVLPSGKEQEFSTATEIRKVDGGIEIYNDTIMIDSFRSADFQRCWIHPRPAIARKRKESMFTVAHSHGSRKRRDYTGR